MSHTRLVSLPNYLYQFRFILIFSCYVFRKVLVAIFVLRKEGVQVLSRNFFGFGWKKIELEVVNAQTQVKFSDVKVGNPFCLALVVTKGGCFYFLEFVTVSMFIVAVMKRKHYRNNAEFNAAPVYFLTLFDCRQPFKKYSVNSIIFHSFFPVSQLDNSMSSLKKRSSGEQNLLPCSSLVVSIFLVTAITNIIIHSK